MMGNLRGSPGSKNQVAPLRLLWCCFLGAPSRILMVGQALTNAEPALSQQLPATRRTAMLTIQLTLPRVGCGDGSTLAMMTVQGVGDANHWQQGAMRQ
eukprot:CAMPEP_0180687654 /NCGR_PEP_ID=MMETSP1037_2-20121125/73573_1 /TAXON_ID=632150 /ORGANISM="Azadinium spinosum, Strain 3D9" /LENGTH=97 /DNA_ID=CAMNT_0022718463 /DNA_START=1671 /DNA_END=1961 /DNA_ORIENTATION=-